MLKSVTSMTGASTRTRPCHLPMKKPQPPMRRLSERERRGSNPRPPTWQAGSAGTRASPNHPLSIAIAGDCPYARPRSSSSFMAQPRCSPPTIPHLRRRQFSKHPAHSREASMTTGDRRVTQRPTACRAGAGFATFEVDRCRFRSTVRLSAQASRAQAHDRPTGYWSVWANDFLKT